MWVPVSAVRPSLISMRSIIPFWCSDMWLHATRPRVDRSDTRAACSRLHVHYLSTKDKVTPISAAVHCYAISFINGFAVFWKPSNSHWQKYGHKNSCSALNLRCVTTCFLSLPAGLAVASAAYQKQCCHSENCSVWKRVWASSRYHHRRGQQRWR